MRSLASFWATSLPVSQASRMMYPIGPRTCPICSIRSGSFRFCSSGARFSSGKSQARAAPMRPEIDVILSNEPLGPFQRDISDRKREEEVSTWETYLEEQQPRYQEELLLFLSIPSISALPEHADAVQRAARWVADRLVAAGLEHVQILPTSGHPVVYGEWLHVPGKPTVMIYGHFDTQPADPLDLWTSPPFEPQIR